MSSQQLSLFWGRWGIIKDPGKMIERAHRCLKSSLRLSPSSRHRTLWVTHRHRSAWKFIVSALQCVIAGKQLSSGSQGRHGVTACWLQSSLYTCLSSLIVVMKNSVPGCCVHSVSGGEESKSSNKCSFSANFHVLSCSAVDVLLKIQNSSGVHS